MSLRQRRIDRLAGELEPLLAEGHVVVDVDEINSIDEWRAGARAAARRSGWRVRTGIGTSTNHVWAVRVDEAAASAAADSDRLRAAINSISEGLFGTLDNTGGADVIELHRRST